MMSQRIPRRRSWRIKTKLSVFITVVAVSALIYWEQSALLYVLSTLAVCILLSLVALADLEGKDRELNPPVNSDLSVDRESSLKRGTYD